MKNPTVQLLLVLLLGALPAILTEALFGAAHAAFTAAWALWCGLLTWFSKRCVVHHYGQSRRGAPGERIFRDGLNSRLLVAAATLGACSAFAIVCHCVVTHPRLWG